ncbi:MAG: hypothetical protein JW818_22310 [Pirellulales bacterium]|nr:hypothetical protein [Pirellulales bacterium]
MDAAHRPRTLSGFCNVLAASGLLDEQQIESTFRDFQSTQGDGESTAAIHAFTSYLIDRGHLTRWQCRKLLDGRFKGFFMDGYVLRDYVDSNDTCNRYLAVEITTGQSKVLAVVLPSLIPLEEGKPWYWVEEPET